MKFVFYTHSLVSCWNHGNAHFQRGVMRELIALGHDVLALEPQDGWSRINLMAGQGEAALTRFARDFPELADVPRTYGADFDHEAALDGADVVIVHEWTDPELVARIGRIRQAGGGFTLAFHDTHHRAASADADIAALILEDYDLVLCFGQTVTDRYLARGWGRNVFTWHEAADTRLFRPFPEAERSRDLVWIGNWGDDERAEELTEFLIEPVKALNLTGTVHGVRYPDEALERLSGAGLEYNGWLPNVEAPEVFARHRMTLHVPRRPYVESLPGIPTIRVFEALACGIPLICAPWEDAEGLFRPGEDYLVARDGDEMKTQMRRVLEDPEMAAALAASGLDRIRSRHTCAHRVQELLDILRTDAAAPRTGEMV
ncbi:hypothetical protein JSE7799_00245 [Jannaschia seosinensis]|uniref:Spore protein YkvP/CgeB glycosyl transferase-like domain-containing protein n=1 Tax=Jannaschia seosinensis TaxID=313367 RepID=A0A0M7B6U9_9RHOB|nr:glycosyltransferase [Jannaschia seosinensis]CUH13326.1 hypothetical protein JSE7799_00245 [Jannaschia seosinensis]